MTKWCLEETLPQADELLLRTRRFIVASIRPMLLVGHHAHAAWAVGGAAVRAARPV